MNSSDIIISKSPEINNSHFGIGKPKKYLKKNYSKKYIYKKEKVMDKRIIINKNNLSPLNIKGKEVKKHILNNSDYDLKRALEIRDELNKNYEQYQQSFYIKNPNITNFNSYTNNSSLLNQSYYLNNLTNSNIINNRWKCSGCGNVNSNFNYLCNNCNLPNNSFEQNNLLFKQKNLSKNIEINKKNEINKNNPQNIFSKNINNNIILRKNFLKNNNDDNNNINEISNPFYSNITNKNCLHKIDYSSNNLNNENKDNKYDDIEYNNNCQQNDSLKQRIENLREKEKQLKKINNQLENTLAFIQEKLKNENMDKESGIIKYIFGIGELKLNLNELIRENENLNNELKESKDKIKKLKSEIVELTNITEDKNKKNIKLKKIKEIKEKINNYIEDIKNQNDIYNQLNNDNRKKKKNLKIIINKYNEDKNDENKENINKENINKKKIIYYSLEKDKYLKIKENNNQLFEFFDELNKERNNLQYNKNRNKSKKYYDNLKKIYSNIDIETLIGIKDSNYKEQEIIEYIDNYMNL